MTGQSAHETAQFVVEAAIWAPSVHNTQPWWFRADSGGLNLYADLGRRLTVADPAGREMMISCGAALFTARLALRELGHVPETAAWPDASDPALIARLTWPRSAAPAAFEQRLFSQVFERRTHRGGFDPAPLPPELLAVLSAGVARDGARLVVTDARDRALLASTVQVAEGVLRQDSRYVQELTAWAPPPLSIRPDGVPSSAYSGQPEHTDPDFPGRDFAHGHQWGSPRFGSATAYHAAGVGAGLVHDAGPARGLGKCRAGAATAAADEHRGGRRGGAAQSADRGRRGARVAQDSGVRWRAPAGRAQARHGHPDDVECAPSRRRRAALRA